MAWLSRIGVSRHAHACGDSSSFLSCAPLFVYHRGVTWPRDAIRWLRCLGGKRGLRIDRDGPDVLLAGIHAVFVTAATRAFAAHHPFPAGHT